MRVQETTFYLEMSDPGQLRPARAEGVDLEVKQAGIPCPELNRFLYAAVGGDWYWIDRLAWTYDRWLQYLDRPELETWVGYVAGTPAGYFELETHPEQGIEIAYFGLLPQFAGRGAGGHLLTAAVRRAWEKQPPRVWVHTSSLDHPAALANYQARGFRLYKEEVSEKDLPDEPPGPWPGARRTSRTAAP
jgi:GNAT superfamily N-acetyltransferase